MTRRAQLEQAIEAAIAALDALDGRPGHRTGWRHGTERRRGTDPSVADVEPGGVTVDKHYACNE